MASVIVTRWSWAQAQLPKAEVVHGGGLLAAPTFFSLAVDPAGNVYVGGSNSSNVIRVAPRGDQTGAGGQEPCVTEILTRANALAHGFDFAGPKGIAIGSDGTVYVGSTGGSAGGPGPNAVKDNLVRIAPDGSITELFNRTDVGLDDLNPGAVVVDESGGTGPFVYVAGVAPGSGALIRVTPDLTAQTLWKNKGGQGLVADGSGNLYMARPAEGVFFIPDAPNGACVENKVCPLVIEQQDIAGKRVTMGCNGELVSLDGAYALALAGGILYVTGLNSNNILRLPVSVDNVLGLPLCVEQIFASGDSGIVFTKPRGIAADAIGNVFASADRSDNVVWIRPDPADQTKVIAQEIINRDNATLTAPSAVAVDTEGDAYVSGNLTSNVFRIRTSQAHPLCGNGVVDGNEACDFARDCCCSVSCQIQPTRGACRGSSGVCDVDDVCDGVSPICTDTRLATGTVCRSAAGTCDVEEACDGGVDCPADEFVAARVTCRSVSGACDVAESCTGTGPDCPPDDLLPRGTVCRPSAEGNTCDLAEKCDGLSATCPEDIDCTRCSSTDDCRASDTCHDVACVQSKCVESEKVALALATCVFSEPFPGNELTTGNDTQCTTMAASGSVCAPIDRQNASKILCKYQNLEHKAEDLLGSACAGQSAPSSKTLRRVQNVFKHAILGLGRIPLNRISDDCRSTLQRRFARLRQNLNASQASLCQP